LPDIRKPVDEDDNFVVVNIYEKLVRENVRDMMSHMDMCSCGKCYADACAMVLNQLPPQYVTTHKGVLLSQLPQMRTENQIELTVKVVQALRMVRSSPRH